MRKLIAGMKISVDGKMEGAEEMADWVEAWSEDYGLTSEIDACLLGGGMYPGYERYWTGIQAEPDAPAWITGAPPTPAEREWAHLIRHTPHYVLSTGLTETQWPDTRFLRGTNEVRALKQQPGKSIYLIGGAQVVAGLMDEGLVDELRLIVYPLICGDGKALFASARRRRRLVLQKAEPLPGGKLSLIYEVG
jgi:dihydrofolate reductase